MLEDRKYYNAAGDDPRITMASVARGLRTIAKHSGEWAGIPSPLRDEQLVIDPSYKFAKALMDCGAAKTDTETTEQASNVVSQFWSWKWRTDVVIFKNSEGKYRWTIASGNNNSGAVISTIGASAAWTLDAEIAALKTLHDLIGHHKFRTYLLTGSFLETSKRSKVTYVFRKLRPTLALGRNRDAEIKVLAALCLHPIGYYAQSWGGAMCPTDDVIAHLMLMRGDEHMYWKRSNQHGAHRKQAGI